MARLDWFSEKNLFIMQFWIATSMLYMDKWKLDLLLSAFIPPINTKWMKKLVLFFLMFSFVSSPRMAVVTCLCKAILKLCNYSIKNYDNFP